jgi:RHS repeat-associated protein
VHAPGSFEPMLQQQNGEVFLCVNDHLGMPKDLVAGDGAVAWSATHSAYGRVVASYVDDAARARYGTAINSPFRLLGQVADDDAELCFTRYRCFDPEIGAWISSDPLGVVGGLSLYGFDGAPTDVVDPLGLNTSGGNPHPTEVIQCSKPHCNGTPGHWEAIQDKAAEMKESGEYKTIYINKGLSNEIPGAKPNRRPDIMGVRHDGTIDQVEVASKTDDPRLLRERMNKNKSQMGTRAGGTELLRPKKV